MPPACGVLFYELALLSGREQLASFLFANWSKHFCLKQAELAAPTVLCNSGCAHWVGLRRDNSLRHMKRQPFDFGVRPQRKKLKFEAWAVACAKHYLPICLARALGDELRCKSSPRKRLDLRPALVGPAAGQVISASIFG